MKRAVAYIRVSTANKSRQGDALTFDQNPEVQEQPLREMVASRGWKLGRVYSDRASGAKERRPGPDALMREARRGEFDVVVVWRFDRFARSVRQLVMKNDNALWQNATTSALLHRETAVTAFQYPFALNLDDFGFDSEDSVTRKKWFISLLKAISELNGVAGNHARSYFEMAPATPPWPR